MTTDYTQGLRELADFLDDHPTLTSSIPCSVYVGAHSAADFAIKCAELGAGTKESTASTLSLVRSFGPHDLHVCVVKDVTCERVQTGTRTVLVPPEDCALVEIEEPVYEWVCPESFLKAGAAS